MLLANVPTSVFFFYIWFLTFCFLFNYIIEEKDVQNKINLR